MPPTGTPFSATTFRRGLVPHPTTVSAADITLVAALAAAKTEAATAKERVRVAALAWEHERTTTDALALQVAEAERFLHASEGEHGAFSQQASPTALPRPSARPPSSMVHPMVFKAVRRGEAIRHRSDA
jgi:hypothetical protein